MVNTYFTIILENFLKFLFVSTHRNGRILSRHFLAENRFMLQNVIIHLPATQDFNQTQTWRNQIKKTLVDRAIFPWNLIQKHFWRSILT